MTISKEITTLFNEPEVYLGHFIFSTLFVTCIYSHKLSTLRFYPNANSANGSQSPTILELPHPTFKLSSLSTQTPYNRGTV